MTLVLGVRLDDAVGRGIVASGVHSIGASFVEGGLLYTIN
jgi:hypothetical protein